MYVESVRIENYKVFAELEMSFIDPETNSPHDLVALTGVNGSGKTTILEVIRDSFQVPGGLREISGQDKRDSAQHSMTAVDFSFERQELGSFIESAKRHYRPEDPDKLTGVLEASGGSGKIRSIGQIDLPQSEATQLLKNGASGVFEAESLFKKVKPILRKCRHSRLIYLSHDRALPKARVKSIGRSPSQLSGSLVLQNFGFTDVKQHLVDLDYLRLKRKESGGPDPLTPYREIVNELFEDKVFDGVTEDLRVLFRTSDGYLIDYDDLSSGERSVLALFSSLIRGDLRHCVYLIDEPGLYLHPKWQMALPRILKKLAETLKSQFILATHSVEIASGIQEEGGVVFSLNFAPEEARS